MIDYSSRTKKTSSARPLMLALAGAFVLGGGLVGYGVYRWTDGRVIEQAAEPAGETPALAAPAQQAGAPSPTPSPTSTGAAQQAADAVERVAEQQGGLDQRLAAAEQRLARLDLQAQSAAGNTARAEGLLIAFAARRTVERGEELGYLADQLRLRFGDALPNAVQTIIDNSRNPVTLDLLVAKLEGLAPELGQADREFSWALLRSELSQMFVIRRESTPSPQPQRRLERARLFLESGRVQAAIDEVKALPGADNAEVWIRDAERYASSQRALDLIETSAVLEPRLLRDGTGARIEQPTIAEQPES